VEIAAKSREIVSLELVTGRLPMVETAPVV
jgi:hypothetical protein